MTAPHLPLYFDATSTILFFREESFRCFSKGQPVALEDNADDSDSEPVCMDPETLSEGPCLVALASRINFMVSPDPEHRRDTIPAADPHGYVLDTTDNLWLAEHHSGQVCRTSDQSLKHLLQAGGAPIGDSVDTIPMRCLEQLMCCDGCALSGRDRTMYQYPDAYRTLYESRNFAGIINRSYCHLGCGADFVWIIDGLCVFWMRYLDGPYVEWIRLFPFRVDCSGKPGRLSSKFRSRYSWRSVLGLLYYVRHHVARRGHDV